MDRAERRELSLALLPWVIFAVVGRNTGEGTAWASFAALVTVLVVSFPSPSRHHLKRLERYAIALFVGLLVVGVFAGADPTAFVNQYGRALAFGGLTLITATSLLFVPYTEEYTRDAVRRRYWDTPSFRRVNFAVSAISAAAYACMTLSFVAGQLWTSAPQNTMFNWVVPIAIAFVATKFATVVWRDYFENHVSAADETREQISMLDILFLDEDRRVG